MNAERVARSEPPGALRDGHGVVPAMPTAPTTRQTPANSGTRASSSPSTQADRLPFGKIVTHITRRITFSDPLRLG